MNSTGRHTTLFLIAALCTVAKAQAPSESAARALGFNDYGAFLRASQYCLSTYSKQVIEPSSTKQCGSATDCMARVVRQRMELDKLVRQQRQWVTSQCNTILAMYMSQVTPAMPVSTFSVTVAQQGCKYFVAQDGVSFSLVDSAICFKPRRGDTGTGDISVLGIREVTLSGMLCNVWVHDTLLSRESAIEKLLKKCE